MILQEIRFYMDEKSNGGTAPETTVEDEMKLAFEWALDMRNHWVWKSGERAFQLPEGWRNRANLDLERTHEEWDDAMVSLGICYRTELLAPNLKGPALGTLQFFLKAGINNPLIERENGRYFGCEDCQEQKTVSNYNGYHWYCESCYRLNAKASDGYHAARHEFGRKPATWLYRPANV